MKLPQKIKELIDSEDSLVFYSDYSGHQRLMLLFIFLFPLVMTIQVSIKSGFSWYTVTFSFMFTIVLLLIYMIFFFSNKHYRFLIINEKKVHFQKFSRFFGLGKTISLTKEDLLEIEVVHSAFHLEKRGLIKESYLTFIDQKYNRNEINFTNSKDNTSSLYFSLVQAPKSLFDLYLGDENITSDMDFIDKFISYLEKLNYVCKYTNHAPKNENIKGEDLTFD